MKEKLFDKNFTIMIIGQLISLLGNSLQRFALSLYILDITGSAAIFSVILSLAILPQIFLAPFGGAISDRFSKKKIMVALDTVSGVLLILFAVLLQVKSATPLILVGILMCIMAIIQSIYEPTVRASLPIMVAADNLPQANSIVSIITALTSLFGPIAAGFVYGFLGIQAIFTINIVSFLISAFMELFLYIEHKKTVIEGNMLSAFCHDIKSTALYLIYEKRVIFYIILLSCLLNLFLTPIYTVGVPYLVKIVFGISDQLYGISEGAMGAGMIIGALMVMPLSKKIPFQKLYLYFVMLTLLILGIGVTTLSNVKAISGPSYLSYFILTAIGFAFSFILTNVNISFMTYLQIETPNELMGKTMALTGALSTALMPIGQIIFGNLYEVLHNHLIIIYLLVAGLNMGTAVILKRILARMPMNDTKEGCVVA